MSVNSDEFFGHYKVVSQIGAGGMGKVYLAQDTKLGRKVAVKILAEEFAKEPARLDRFIQEAQAASALNHPNIITIHEIGETSGTNYIATEFIEGETLRERFSEGKFTFDEVLSIAIQTAEALAAAHTAGIVHRDIKPENIMIRGDGYLKVLDFGLAKLTESGRDAKDAGAPTLKIVDTHPGVVMGTVSYMSPEQARAQATDARSDIFSFGIVLYEMLAGHPPFEGDSVTDIMAAIVGKDPRPLAEVVAGLPAEFQRIISKMLRKKADERYQSTKDLLVDLKDLRADLALKAKLESSPTRKILTSRISPKITTSSGSAKNSVVLTEFENLTGDPVFDATLKTALAFSLEQSPTMEIYPETQVTATLRILGYPPGEKITVEIGQKICQYRGLKAYIHGTISVLGNLYVVTLEAVNARTGESLGRQLEQAESKEQVLNALSKAAAGLRETLGEGLSSLERSYAYWFDCTTSSLESLKSFSMGIELIKKGKVHNAAAFLQKSIELDPQFATPYITMAVLYSNSGQRKLAAEYAAKAFELRELTGEAERIRISYFYYFIVTGELDKQIETLELWKETYPTQAVLRVNLSDYYQRIGQFQKAAAVALEAVGLDPENSVAFLNYIESLVSLGRFDEARQACEQAFANDLDGELFHVLLYVIAFIENDADEMAGQLTWFDENHGRHTAASLQAGVAAFLGQWRKAHEFSRRAIEWAERAGAKEIAARYAAEQALRIVFWSVGRGLPRGGDAGLRSVLNTQTRNALKLERGILTVAYTALALALSGATSEAKKLRDELAKEHPKDTLVNELWLPLLLAAEDMQAGRWKAAVRELESTKRFEKACEFYPQYLRGLALLELNENKLAAAEFDKILEHRGEAPLSSLYPLAQLGKARALKDRAEYEKFFDLWAKADDDMPALVEARKEHEAVTA